MVHKRKKTKTNRSLIELGKLAHRLNKERRYDEAVEKYLKILKIDPDNVYALAGLGDSYRGLKDVDKALDVWSRYLSLRPDDYRILTRVADGFRKKGDLETSKRYYLLALKKNRLDPYALMGLGNICMIEGLYREALQYFERLIGTPDETVVVCTSAANIYRKQREYQRAKLLYERALEIDPENSHAWHGKADCLRGLKQYEPAIRSWKKALKHGMNPRICLTRIGDSYINMKDLKKAEENYSNALSLGYDKYAYLGMIKIHVMRNELNNASGILSMLTERDPYDGRIADEFKRFYHRYPQITGTSPKM